MKSLHMLNDVDGAWVKLVKEAKDGVGKVVPKENTDSVNTAAVMKQAGLLVELKKRMLTMASKSWAGSWSTGEILVSMCEK